MQQPLKVGPGEAPGKRDRGLLVAALEGEQAVLDLGKIGEVVGGQDLPPADGQVDLDLVQPGRVDRLGAPAAGSASPPPAGRSMPGPDGELPWSTTQNTRAAEA
jgi:hypothetical protein